MNSNYPSSLSVVRNAVDALQAKRNSAEKDLNLHEVFKCDFWRVNVGMEFKLPGNETTWVRVDEADHYNAVDICNNRNCISLTKSTTVLLRK